MTFVDDGLSIEPEYYMPVIPRSCQFLSTDLMELALVGLRQFRTTILVR